ncbi:MAG: TrkA family potassium uptake protein [Spirochaetae bacterium HGW-Spirochaetae-7]|jgi:trk system potassium uptake protein TrkA|nr:MAG: TrkA family potassium uptake protein [Spirochaetae bacterium HGW-Spirochaetae-7]
MGRQYVIVGLGSFGVRVLEKLSEATDQIIIIDKDKAIIEKYKDLASKSFIADALNKQALSRIIPEAIDVAIVDVGDNIEVAVIVTNALKKIGAGKIIVRAETEERGEILEIVGATMIVYPAKEAATKIVPMLVSSSLFSFMAISPSLVLAEIRAPERYVGSTLVEANFRQSKGINVVAIRKEEGDEYEYFDPRYRLLADDVMLCAGSEKDVTAFTGVRITARKNVIGEMLRGIFGKPRPIGDKVEPVKIE